MSSDYLNMKVELPLNIWMMSMGVGGTNERTKEVTALPPSVESAHRMKFVRPSESVLIDYFVAFYEGKKWRFGNGFS